MSKFKIDFLVQGNSHFCEMSPDNVLMSECIVESQASVSLLALFERIYMLNVAVTFSQDKQVTVAIQAEGEDPRSDIDPSCLDCAVEDCLTDSLVEFCNFVIL